MQAETIISALGVADASDFDQLVVCLTDNSDGVGLVDPDDVIRRLKAFVEEELRSMPSRRHPTHMPTAARAGRRDVYEHEYWERLSNVVADRMCRIWKALDAAMLNYNTTLEQRSAALTEIQVLGRQNAELRGLLETYRRSKQTAALIIAPRVV